MSHLSRAKRLTLRHGDLVTSLPHLNGDSLQCSGKLYRTHKCYLCYNRQSDLQTLNTVCSVDLYVNEYIQNFYSLRLVNGYEARVSVVNQQVNVKSPRRVIVHTARPCKVKNSRNIEIMSISECKEHTISEKKNSRGIGSTNTCLYIEYTLKMQILK